MSRATEGFSVTTRVLPVPVAGRVVFFLDVVVEEREGIVNRQIPGPDRKSCIEPESGLE